MNYILFGDNSRTHLLPFTHIRPVADIRVGILTLRQKWEHMLNASTSSLTADYLSEKYPLVKEADNVLINSSVFPTPELVREIGRLQPNQTLVSGELLLAHRLKAEDIDNMDIELLDEVVPMETASPVRKLANLWEIVHFNSTALREDYELITRGRKSMAIPSHVRVISPENVFVEEGANIEMAIINASEGPVYIGKNVHIMDGAMLRGPLAIGEGSIVRMGAKIYGNTSIGPYSKVAGEITDTVIFGYSNKSHDGFLGHSVIGEWCNLGADSNTSNLKINYDEIRLWDYEEQSFISTGLQLCGTFMGDYSKCGVNTMFNSGTVLGVSVQIYGTGFLRNFIPSFTWGSVSGFASVKIDKAIQTARLVCARRNVVFDKLDEDILRHVFNNTVAYRKV